MKAPFPWFGGKSQAADVVWRHLGNVPNYVEPFFGSGAVLLQRPYWTPASTWIETVNDKDGFISNFWRAIQADPEEVAFWASWPANENDLQARHVWLRERRDALQQRLEGDPNYYEAQLAGWWLWGICLWIGSGWCDPDSNGPWIVIEDEEGLRRLVNSKETDTPTNEGHRRQLVHLFPGRGVHRKVPLDADADRNEWGDTEAGDGSRGIYAWMHALSSRLRRVRVASGDWTRVLTNAPTTQLGLTGVFLDPPYGVEIRTGNLYANDTAENDISADVRQWCIDNGDNPDLRIALCGYDTEHGVLETMGWSVHRWSARGGYGSQGENEAKDNRHRETIWFSPACITENQLRLF